LTFLLLLSGNFVDFGRSREKYKYCNGTHKYWQSLIEKWGNS